MASSKEQVVFGSDSLVRQANLPSLADLLTLERRASIFYSYAREIDTSERFSNDDDSLTMFVPTNKAVMALARKPHQDPDNASVGLSDTEYETVSRSNVRRWVGAHIIPNSEVNFTSDKPYSTLTDGVAISFKPISYAYHPPGEPVIDADPAHFASVKGGSPAMDSDAENFDFIKKPGPVIDTDAAHFASVKSTSSPDNNPHVSDKPIWRKYLINDDIHIIDEKKASNGILYLIDGTVNV